MSLMQEAANSVTYLAVISACMYIYIYSKV